MWHSSLTSDYLYLHLWTCGPGPETQSYAHPAEGHTSTCSVCYCSGVHSCSFLEVGQLVFLIHSHWLCAPTQASQWFTAGWRTWRCWKPPSPASRVSSRIASLLWKTPKTGVSAPLSTLGGATTRFRMSTLTLHGKYPVELWRRTQHSLNVVAVGFHDREKKLRTEGNIGCFKPKWSNVSKTLKVW